MTQARFLLLALLFANACSHAQAPSAPTGLSALGYEQHIELTWQANTEPNLSGYKIYRSTNSGASFDFLKQVGKEPIAVDWTGDEGQNLSRQYKIAAVAGAAESGFSNEGSATTHPMSDEELLEMTSAPPFAISGIMPTPSAVLPANARMAMQTS